MMALAAHTYVSPSTSSIFKRADIESQFKELHYCWILASTTDELSVFAFEECLKRRTPSYYIVSHPHDELVEHLLYKGNVKLTTDVYTSLVVLSTPRSEDWVQRLDVYPHLLYRPLLVRPGSSLSSSVDNIIHHVKSFGDYIEYGTPTPPCYNAPSLNHVTRVITLSGDPDHHATLLAFLSFVSQNGGPCTYRRTTAPDWKDYDGQSLVYMSTHHTDELALLYSRGFTSIEQCGFYKPWNVSLVFVCTTLTFDELTTILGVVPTSHSSSMHIALPKTLDSFLSSVSGFILLSGYNVPNYKTFLNMYRCTVIANPGGRAISPVM